jgi:hypothetical protein
MGSRPKPLKCHAIDTHLWYAARWQLDVAQAVVVAMGQERSHGVMAPPFAARLGLGAAQSWPAEAAMEFWGREKAMFSLGSNSHVRGRAAEILGWAPQHRSIKNWIARELV